jgi:hypothetical protein
MAFDPNEVNQMMELESSISSGYNPTADEVQFMMDFDNRVTASEPESNFTTRPAFEDESNDNSYIDVELGRREHGDNFFTNRITEPLSELANDYINEPIAEFALNNPVGNMAANAASQIAKPLGGAIEFVGDTAAGLGFEDNALQRYGEQIRDDSDLVSSTAREQFGADDSFGKSLLFDAGSGAWQCTKPARPSTCDSWGRAGSAWQQSAPVAHGDALGAR